MVEPTQSNGLGSSWVEDISNYIYIDLNVHSAKIINFFNKNKNFSNFDIKVVQNFRLIQFYPGDKVRPNTDRSLHLAEVAVFQVFFDFNACV